MIHSSERLKKTQEAMEYSKRLLKLYTTEFNKKQIDIDELLTGYSFYIKSQIENKCFSDALKTFEKLKIYSLNSMNPQDVHTVFKDKFENLVQQLNQLGDKEAGELSRAKLCPLKDLGYRVGEMCEQKSIIFAKLGNRILSDQWIDV